MLIVIDHDIEAVRLVDEIVAPHGMVVLHCEGLLESAQVYDQAAAILCEFHLHACTAHLWSRSCGDWDATRRSS